MVTGLSGHRRSRRKRTLTVQNLKLGCCCHGCHKIIGNVTVKAHTTAEIRGFPAWELHFWRIKWVWLFLDSLNHTCIVVLLQSSQRKVKTTFSASLLIHPLSAPTYPIQGCTHSHLPCRVESLLHPSCVKTIAARESTPGERADFRLNSRSSLVGANPRPSW